MKPLLTWNELTPKQKDAATMHEYNLLLEFLTEGEEFGDETIDAGVKAAAEECERLRTPWFIGATIHEKVGDLLMQHINTMVQRLYYCNPDHGLLVSGVVLPRSED